MEDKAARNRRIFLTSTQHPTRDATAVDPHPKDQVTCVLAKLLDQYASDQLLHLHHTIPSKLAHDQSMLLLRIWHTYRFHMVQKGDM